MDCHRWFISLSPLLDNYFHCVYPMSVNPSTTNNEDWVDIMEDIDFAFGHAQNKAKKIKPHFEYTEHGFIGDSIRLTLADGQQIVASDYKFALSNGLNLTYGQINGLAGDFYGTKDPISDGITEQDRTARFVAAYNTLASDTTRQPKEATEILAVLQAEVDALNEALSNHQDPSIAYSKHADPTLKLEWITTGRKDNMSYLQLALHNWDHFGVDARMAYNTGHAIAIQKAIDGDLEGAYAMNAFADHFLEDSFSAGHLRTPRRLLHNPKNPISDLCAKFMHDEDNAIGLQVTNPVGESWTCYGDKRAFGKKGRENLERCVQAVQASTNEVYKAFTSKEAPAPANYVVWQIAPTLESARATTQELVPLFTFKNERRRVLKDRCAWDFKTDWWYLTTATECKTSGLWSHPITFEALQRIPYLRTDFCIISPRIGSLTLIHQLASGSLVSNQHVDGSWTPPRDKLITEDAMRLTPLASVNWDSGRQIRVYYLDRDYIVQEYCYSDGRGWYAGSIGSVNITAAHSSTQLAAVYYGPDDSDHIRIYLQEAGSSNVREVRYDDGHWSRGYILSPALEGTSIAAVTCSLDEDIQIRVYFQKDDLSLLEFFHDRQGWHQGDWSSAKALKGSSIDAAAWMDDNRNSTIQVYWQDIDDNIVTSKHLATWEPVVIVLQGVVPSGFRFYVLQWDQGRKSRVYWQRSNGLLCEHCSDDSCQSWSVGSLSIEA